MALPINITDLVHGKTIEWERLEFKRNWNPEEIVHTICAFANDLHNWGGGYIVVGIEENAGQPVLPPSGLQQNRLDFIQGEIVKLGNQMQPNYFPICQPYLLDGQHIMVLWCPAGDNRPFTAPSTQGAKAQRHSYVRVGSRSVVARGVLLTQLQELTARIPFDDRVNNQATIDHFDLGTIQAFLQEIKSDLYTESTKMSLTEIARTMLIAKGPEEDLRPVNVGLLFFSKVPEAFFPRTQIELVWHKDNSGKAFKEYSFNGPLHEQLRKTLSFIHTNIISEQVVKHKNKAEAERFFNYPFTAIEEALSNAVYHKSYEVGSPIEIQVWPNKIEILSFPGPVPPVTAHILSTQKRIVAREYRNRRIGDFLKELRLTEGRGTGLPSIYAAMEDNGNPAPVFETDDQSTYFLVTLSARGNGGAGDQASDQVKAFDINTIDDIIAFSNEVSDQVSDQASAQVKEVLDRELHSKVEPLLIAVLNWNKRSEIMKELGISNHSTHREKYLDPLLDLAWVHMEYPETPTSPKQRYKITDAGKRILDLITVK
tara:strand:+ start:499 stop:2121 length:1623 start_codon:yes stop_codon:yes gene_type:complete